MMPFPRRPTRYFALLLLCFFLVVIGFVVYPSSLNGPRPIPPPPSPGPASCSEADYSAKSMVPPLIHQNYFAPLDSPDESFKKLNPYSQMGRLASLESFPWQLSPFEYRFYSESAAKRLLQTLEHILPKDAKFKLEDYIKTWESLPRIILKADFWRYIVLYIYGGIYTDTDVELGSPLPWQVLCDDTAWPGMDQKGGKLGTQKSEENIKIRAIDDKLSNLTKLFVGIEDSHTPDGDPSSVTRSVQLLTWYAQASYSNIGSLSSNYCRTIVAAPAHPAILKIMEHIVSESPHFIERYKENGKVEHLIMDWTGPGVWTDVVFDWVNSHQGNGNPRVQDSMLRLSSPMKVHDTLFLPRMAWGAVPGMKGKPSDGLLVRHGYEGSWKPKGG
jgi:hypothetical protein